jgi:hypothetical protein
MKKLTLVILFFLICSSYFANDLSKQEIISGVNDYFGSNLVNSDNTLIVNKIDELKWELIFQSKTLSNDFMNYFLINDYNIANVHSDYKIIIDRNNATPQYLISFDNGTKIMKIDSYKNLYPDLEYVELSSELYIALRITYEDFSSCLRNPLYSNILESKTYTINSYDELICETKSGIYTIIFHMSGKLDGAITYTLNSEFEILSRLMPRYNTRELNKFEFIRK